MIVSSLEGWDWVFLGRKQSVFYSGVGTWRTHGVFEQRDLQTVPTDIPLEYAANVGINPTTALRLLEDFETLQAGKASS